MRSPTFVVLALGLIAVVGCGSNPSGPPAGAVTTGPDSTETPTGETVEHPTYKLWARFPPGTSVTQRTTTENENNTQKTVTTIIYTLKERADDYIVVESKAATVHYNGRVEENPPDAVKTRKLLRLPPGTKKDERSKPKKETETGEETVTVAGKQYKAVWALSKDFTEAGELLAKTWTSDEMPGGLVKSVSKVATKQATITIEVIEVKIP